MNDYKWMIVKKDSAFLVTRDLVDGELSLDVAEHAPSRDVSGAPYWHRNGTALTSGCFACMLDSLKWEDSPAPSAENYV